MSKERGPVPESTESRFGCTATEHAHRFQYVLHVTAGSGWGKLQGSGFSMIWSDCPGCGEAAVLVMGPVDELHRCQDAQIDPGGAS